jgi:hypothetical protein
MREFLDELKSMRREIALSLQVTSLHRPATRRPVSASTLLIRLHLPALLLIRGDHYRRSRHGELRCARLLSSC